MSQSELLKKVTRVLDDAHVPYMLTGSHASSLQGEVRFTHDIDLVVKLHPAGIKLLLLAFPSPEYYLDSYSIASAVASKTQFNLLVPATGDKVDFWMLTDDPFNQSRFGRRYVEMIDGHKIYVSRPEDTIVMKLRWADMCGGSEKQFRDAKGVYELQFATLDLAYIEHWIGALNLQEYWERLKREAEPL